jgi:hypothetical protein
MLILRRSRPGLICWQAFLIRDSSIQRRLIRIILGKALSFGHFSSFSCLSHYCTRTNSLAFNNGVEHIVDHLCIH